MVNPDAIQKGIRNARTLYDRAVGERDSVSLDRSSRMLINARNATNLSMFEEELAVILKASSIQIEQAGASLSEAVTYAMQGVLDPEYQGIRFNMDTTGRSPVASIVVLKKGPDGLVYESNPIEDNAGGVNDIISSILKFSTLNGYQPAVENAALFDEPSKHLSTAYRDGLSKVFRDFVGTTGRQLVMVTHDTTLTMHSDNVIDFDEE